MTRISEPDLMDTQHRVDPSPSIEDILAEAVDYLDEMFNSGDDVNGGDAVEWLAEWRVRARAALEQSSSSS